MKLFERLVDARVAIRETWGIDKFSALAINCVVCGPLLREAAAWAPGWSGESKRR